MPPPDSGGRLRIAWWGPLPPSESVTAWQSPLLLRELASHHDVVAVSTGTTSPPPDLAVPVTTIDDPPTTEDVDLDVFNLESSLDEFARVHEAMRTRPGVVVLHEASLLHLYRQMYDGDERLAEEVRYSYGDLPDLDLRLETACAPGGDPLDLPLLRRACESSRAVVVHDTTTRDDLVRRFPLVPISAVPLAAPIPHAPSARRSPPDELRVAVFGGSSGLEIAETAARTVGRTGVDVQAFDGASEPDGVLDTCDLVADLTWPSSGGTRREVATAVQAGMPVVVMASPHAPEHGGWVRTIPFEPGAAIRALCSILADHARGDVSSRLPAATPLVAPVRTVALQYDAILRAASERSTPVPTEEAPRVLDGGDPIGVNVIGDFDATTGLMEAGRRMVRSFVAAHADVLLQTFPSAAGSSRTRRTNDSDRLPRGRHHDIDLLLLNVNEMSSVKDAWLRPPGTNRYVIGTWFWELSELTEDLSRHAQRVDEIWVASEFVRGAFRGATRCPVVLIPPSIETLLPPHFDTTSFGIRDGALVYFFNFDALSTAARKNPWGVIDAFCRAFDSAERAGPAQLVIKVHNLERVPALAEPLTAAVAAAGGVLIDAELTRDEMNGLLGRCDVYTSLHRSEGFGLGMAEAMYLGKPVIATAYSGNVDFTLPNTSCLVGYRMRSVTNHDHRHFPEAASLYPSGLVWAEPDLDAATRWMRLLYESPELRRRVGLSGAREIRDRYSPGAEQTAITERLEALRERSSPVEAERLVDELEVPLGSGSH